MNQTFFDLECTDLNTNFSQILSVYSELRNDTFDRLDQPYESVCNLRPGVLPSVDATLITGLTPTKLSKNNKSSHVFTKELYEMVKKYTPSIFTSFNGISYDHPMLRSAFYQNLLPVYAEQFNGNLRHDILATVRATSVFDPGKIKYPLNEKKLPYFKLADLCKENNIKPEGAFHESKTDVLSLIALGKLIYEKCPTLWKSALLNLDTSKSSNTVVTENLFATFEFFSKKVFQKIQTFCLEHPVYKNYMICADLSHAPEDMLGLLDNREAFKKYINSTPKKFRTYKANKSHPLFHYSFGLKDDPYKTNPYKTIGEAKLIERSKIIRDNKEKISVLMRSILQEQADEKLDLDDQLEGSLYPEETLYSSGFTSSKDKQLMENFHTIDSWDSKVNFIGKFESANLNWFCLRIIYEESPSSLSKDLYNQIHREIAKRLFSENKEKFNTIKEVQFQLDQKYSEIEDNKDQEKMLILKDIENYVDKVKKDFESA